MKKLMIGLMFALLLVLSSCDFGDLTGGWNSNNDNITLDELISAELLAEADLDAVIEEDIEIEIPSTLAKAAPGPGGNGGDRGKRRVQLRVKQGIDSVDVSHSVEYTSDDTALVTVTKTIYATMVINQTDTAIVDSPEVWEKPYVYTTTSYMQFVQVPDDSIESDTLASDSTDGWKLFAKSIESGETDGILNTIASVSLRGDDDSTLLVFDDTQALYEMIRKRADWGYFRGRPGDQQTEVFVVIDGSDDVNVLGSSGRYFKLLDDGEGIDLTADDNIYSGVVLKGRGQSRLRVRMITTATFIDADAPVEIATWFLPVR